ncbi:tRNA methyltransferase complex GCD14 subunit-domain-containing protein [Triangularia verruculosa]|uniref:tRNA (adenine(58)-N(1))-methyltransferase catalytic subunit TRM61 n=1 Tax=Triangularia verruculosa TaxID=2587418 RepID=A0AAN7AZ70_9PEZI|nr:tRNA methyltransferase complex GCD14 subunit-domain-containing protein [Triangularia verruculosa]
MDDTMAPVTRNQAPKISPFLEPGKTTKVGSLAILQLSRDNLQPVYLQAPSGKHDGYAEGAVVNTRYGSFPHSTMIGVPWGSQIRASKVDTGSRGRNNKRKRNKSDDDGKEGPAAIPEAKTEPESTPAEVIDDSSAATKKVVADVSGFIHILPPTPEVWTSSLPHRTQVVYTPDYSYVLHRIRARPGSVLIEAGAGSGSFTHASVRAVYNGYPTEAERKGKVYSFEFHEQRFHKMNKELKEHNLGGLVHLTHRDVYSGGFLIDGKSPEAEAIFLDLPAPWEALHHLSRRNPKNPGDKDWVSPLNPKRSAHICTFSPCIEQVTKTVSAMRRLGWVGIDMVEIVNRKYHTSRERVGLNLSMDRGVNNSARDVDEALARLTEIETRFREHAAKSKESDDEMDGDDDGGLIKMREKKELKGGKRRGGEKKVKVDHKPASPESFETPASGVPLWMEGRLITRGEPEIKTHTSYLVFATLPREWTDQDEAAAASRYPVVGEQKVIGVVDKAARKQERREQLQKATGNRKARRMERAAELAVTAEGTAPEVVP